jgi:DNA/RNA-binding domain of Phe-tRNA-synthetase-like protein
MVATPFHTIEKMKLAITPKVFTKYPQLRVGFLLATNIDNVAKKKEAEHLLKDATRYLHLTFNKETAHNHHLLSPWNSARAHLGKKAHHYHTSVERLLRKVLKKQSVTGTNVVTSLTNYLSLKHVLPISADNYHKIDRQFSYMLASGREKISMVKTLKKGALYHKDTSSVLGTQLDYWKSPKMKLSPSSTAVLIHIPTLPPVRASDLNAVMKETATLIQSFCGGDVDMVVLHKRKKEVIV